MKTSLLLFGLAAVASSALLHGEVLFSDDFTHANGSLTKVSGGTWKAHSAAGNGPVLVQGEAALLSRLNREDVSATLSGGPQTNSPLYAGFVLTLSALPDPGAGTFFWHLANRDIGYRALVSIATNDAVEGTFRVGIASRLSSTGLAPLWIEKALSPGVSYQLVVRYDPVTEDSTLWIDPAAEDSLEDRADASGDPSTAVEIVRVALRQDDSNGGMGELTIDDLVVGTEFIDVQAPDVVPEPIPLLYSEDETDLVLIWSHPDFNLQASPLPDGTYTNVPGAVSPFTNSLSESRLFYRLKWP